MKTWILYFLVSLVLSFISRYRIFTYKIQIVDYAPVLLQDSLSDVNAIWIQLVNVNYMLQELKKYASNATRKADIALFPEYALQAPIIRTRKEVSLYAQIYDTKSVIDLQDKTPHMQNAKEYEVLNESSHKLKNALSSIVIHDTSNESSHNTSNEAFQCDKWEYNEENDRNIILGTEIANRKYLVLEKLACMAIQQKQYIAVGVMEQHTSKDEYFNSLIVLDRDGKLVSKYRKRHLYGNELSIFNVGYDDNPEFRADFGQNFGLLICFDLMFRPHDEFAMNDMNRNITSWIVSSWWVNMPPQINALQMQMAYSGTFDLDLFVANSGYSWHSSGSGGYVNGQPLGYIYNPTTTPITQSSIIEVLDTQSNDRQQQSLIQKKKRLDSTSLLRDTQSNNEMLFNRKYNVNLGRDKIVPIQSNTLKKHMESEKIIEYKIIEVNASCSQLSGDCLPAFEGTIHSGTIKCHISGAARIHPFSKQSTTYVYALYASSGRIWPAREGDICGIIYCGYNLNNPEEICLKVLKQENMKHDAPLAFESIQIHTHFDNAVYGAFPLIGMTNMSLPSKNDFILSTFEQGFDYSLSWEGGSSKDKTLASFQILGLRDE